MNDSIHPFRKLASSLRSGASKQMWVPARFSYKAKLSELGFSNLTANSSATFDVTSPSP